MLASLEESVNTAPNTQSRVLIIVKFLYGKHECSLDMVKHDRIKVMDSLSL